MIVVKLQGGLGNQMFQYAAARGISKQNGCIYPDHTALEENTNDTEHFTARNYELGIFKNIKARRANAYSLNLFKSPSLIFRLLRSLLKVSVIQQKANEYIDLQNLPLSRYCYLDGYFQSEKYFKHIRKQLLEEFTFPPLDTANDAVKNTIINSPNSVSIHIRRGDYLRSQIILDYHGVLPVTYYYKALETLKEKYADLTAFVFSDDINWAKANLKLPGIKFHFTSENGSANSWKDMALISYCKHHIIANSSFSWWGAWLSENNGDVFAPGRWFNPLKVNFNIRDFIPGNWTVLNVE